MSNKLKRVCFAALCCVVFCSTSAFAQESSDGCDSFSSGGGFSMVGGDAFSSGVASAIWKDRKKFSLHAMEATPPNPDISGRAGDEFSGWLTELEMQYYLTHSVRGNDAFDSSLACVGEGVMVYHAAPHDGAFIVGQSPFPGEKRWDAFLAGRASRPVKLSVLNEYGRVPPLAWQLPKIGYMFPVGRVWMPSRSGRSWVPLRGGKPITNVAAKGMSGQAGVLPEPRWPDSNLPLKVYISGTVAAARDGLVSHEIKSALRQWREATNGKLYYVLTDHYVDADIVFVCENTSGHQWAESIADYHNNMYNRVRICMLSETLLKLDPNRVRALCLHEVGHAFGIRNHSPDNRDAMSLAATDDFHPVLGLSNNDRKLIAKLYP